MFRTWKAYCINAVDIMGVETNAIIVEVNILIRKRIFASRIIIGS
jgi:hypothetical protein